MHGAASPALLSQHPVPARLVLIPALHWLEDAWLRWHGSARANAKNRVQSPEAWLVTVTTRLAIERLRSRKSERETYIDKSWDVGWAGLPPTRP
ncbi:hypothetical protein LPB04_01060 [Massilia litorea]|uniref:RNA polymerase sigma-70 region 2 domain-containing protein n=1 Tax=Massilia litorea TaxID=2769491 RepID=A0A7L9U715_9BURK|nr:hypothetical protein LPB04_01060 [Massilia litorea]